MRLKDIIKTDLNIEINGISYNSKTTKAGDVFVAISGFNVDGHSYALKAQQNGAVCIICEREIEGLTVPAIIVDDTRATLARMSHKFYGEPTKEFKLVGITGTNGKTTVTYLIKEILEKAGEKVGLIGTNQNMIGSKIIETQHTTPESLELAQLFRQMSDEGCGYVVMEVSSHSLELKRVEGCEFEIGAFTNLSQDHLDFHKTMENYLIAKSKLFNMCKYAIINIDDEGGKIIASGTNCDVTTYGINAAINADISASNIVAQSTGVEFTCLGQKIKLGIPGRFSVYNALAAIGICSKLGFSINAMAMALEKATGVKGRIEVVPTGRDFTILIDYAHTPDGLKNVLQSVRAFAEGRVVVLFGCGGDRDTGKRPQMGKIAGELADYCIVTSDNPRTEDPAAIIRDILSGMKEATAEYIVLENRRSAIEYAIKHAKPKDVIVLAGKGHETYQILGSKTIHFDEREIVSEILSDK